jgi:SH3-like domain-containing protein
MRNWMAALVLGALILGGIGGTGRAGHAGESTLPPPPPPPPPPTAESPSPARAETTPGLPPPPGGQSVQPDAAVAPPIETPAGARESAPRPGRIQGGRVNIRSGPSTNYEIVTTVNEGTPLQVVARAGEWLKIRYPADQSAWIPAANIQGEVPSVIPGTGVVRTVSENATRVRVRPWVRSTVVGEVNEGTTVRIKDIRGQWLKIAPPPTARAWVFGKYVRFEGDVTEVEAPAQPAGEAAGAAAPASPGEAAESRVDSEGMEETLLAQQLEEKRQQRIAEMKAEAEARRLAAEQAAQAVIDRAEERLRRIEEETRRRQEAIDRSAVAVEVAQEVEPGQHPGGAYVGWVEYVGRLGQRPAAYRLNHGGEVQFLLRSPNYDLRRYVNRRVAVDGPVEAAPGWEANVLVVESLELLDEGPIEEPLEIGPFPAEEAAAPPPLPAGDAGDGPVIFTPRGAPVE